MPPKKKTKDAMVNSLSGVALEALLCGVKKMPKPCAEA
jgi:hypothetical protein